MFVDRRTMMRKAETVGILERMCLALELTTTQFETARARYEAVGDVAR